MLKYAPSLLVRKRHYGDTQDPVATRTSGVGASARNLIFVDGILISSPIGNNNTTASPHFGVAAPQDVSRIDVLYGPFSARYAGNSIGATINITTRMPDHFELYGDATGAVQNFHQYGTNETPGTWQLAGGVGDRYGAFSWRLSANHLDSHGQPLGYATLTRPATTSAAGTVLTGAFNDLNRTGAPIAVIGATGIEHQVQDTDTLKLAYDFDNQLASCPIPPACSTRTTMPACDSYLRDAVGHHGLYRQQQYQRLQLQHRRQHLLQQCLQHPADPAGAGPVADLGARTAISPGRSSPATTTISTTSSACRPPPCPALSPPVPAPSTA